MRVDDIAVRARRRATVDDHAIAIQIQPVAGFQVIGGPRLAEEGGPRVDGLRAVVAEGAPSVRLGRSGILAGKQ